MTDTYVRLEFLNGSRFRGFDDYTVPWKDFLSTMEEIMDARDMVALKMTITELTAEEFESICQGEES